MIIIEKGLTNSVILTLSEKRIISGTVSYLFNFINDTTGLSKTFISSDLSSFKQRYNEFNIEENVVEDLLNGVVYLPGTDNFWTYNVYEQLSDTNLDVDNAYNLLETGKLYVSGTESNLDSIYI